MNRTAIQIAVTMHQSLEYLKNLPITEFADLVELIVEIQEERRKPGKRKD